MIDFYARQVLPVLYKLLRSIVHASMQCVIVNNFKKAHGAYKDKSFLTALLPGDLVPVNIATN